MRELETKSVISMTIVPFCDKTVDICRSVWANYEALRVAQLNKSPEKFYQGTYYPKGGRNIF